MVRFMVMVMVMVMVMAMVRFRVMVMVMVMVRFMVMVTHRYTGAGGDHATPSGWKRVVEDIHTDPQHPPGGW